MKKLLCLLMSVVILTGCSAKKQEEETKYDEPISENVVAEEISYEETTVEDIFGEDIFTSDEVINYEDSEIMSPAEVIDKVVTSLNSGCKMTQNIAGVAISMSVVGDAARIEVGAMKMYLDNNYVYIVVDEGESYKSTIGEFKNEANGISSSISIGSVQDVKAGIKEILMSLSEPSATEDFNKYSVEYNKDGETFSGDILFSNGVFSKIQFLNDSQFSIAIEPCNEDISVEVASLDATEATVDEIAGMLTTSLMLGAVTSTHQVELNVSDSVNNFEHSVSAVTGVTEENRSYLDFNDVYDYEEYVEFCNEYGVEQKYSYEDKYYLVCSVVQDSPFTLIAEELMYSNDTIDATVAWDYTNSPGGLTANALVVVLDEKPTGQSVVKHSVNS